MAYLTTQFLHKFCGQYCAQGQRSVRKALICKGKFPLPVFWADWRLSTSDGLKGPRRRVFSILGRQLKICFKGMHINCGKRCAQTTEPPGKSLIYMRTTCRAWFLGKHCCQFRRQAALACWYSPVFAGRRSSGNLSHLLHKFCGKDCEQGPWSRSKVLNLKDKFPLRSFWAPVCRYARRVCTGIKTTLPPGTPKLFT